MTHDRPDVWGGAGSDPWALPAIGAGSADAVVARALAGVPGYEHWTHEPLPGDLERVLPLLDEQQLMTVAATALLRLMHQQRGRAA